MSLLVPLIVFAPHHSNCLRIVSCLIHEANSLTLRRFILLESLYYTHGVPRVVWVFIIRRSVVITLTYLFLYYVYWTVQHLDSWIKIDQLDVTCFIISLFTAQRVSNVKTSILRSMRLIVDLFHVLYCSGSMCVGVTVWFGWGGVVSLCRLKH